MSTKIGQLAAQGNIDFERQINLLSALSIKAIEGAQKIFALQFDFIDKELQASRQFKSKLGALKNPQDVLTQWSQITQAGRPGIEKYVHLGNELAAVCAETHARLCDAANISTARPLLQATPTPAIQPTAKPAAEKKSVAALPAKTPEPIVEKRPAPSKPVQNKAPVKNAPVNVKPVAAKPFPKSVFAQATAKPEPSSSSTAKPQAKLSEKAILTPVIAAKTVESEIKSALAIVKAAEPATAATVVLNKPAKK